MRCPREADFDAALALLDQMNCAGPCRQAVRRPFARRAAANARGPALAWSTRCWWCSTNRARGWTPESASGSWLGSNTPPRRGRFSGRARLVFVTHHVEEIMPAFDRTLVMRRGRIAAAGPTREVVTAERLAERLRRRRGSTRQISRSTLANLGRLTRSRARSLTAGLHHERCPRPHRRPRLVTFSTTGSRSATDPWSPCSARSRAAR